MPEKSPFAEGNLGMQRYQIRYYMKRFIGGILNAKPSEDTTRWRQPPKNTPINNLALEEQRYLNEKKIAHENLILSQHIHHIKTENRKETTIEYADGWRIAKSGGNTRPVIDCYPTQRRIALNFHNLHSRKHTDEKMKKIRAYQDDRMNKNIEKYRSEYNLKTLIKSYNKKKYLMTNMTSKIPRTVLHIGLKAEALKSLKRDKLLAAGLRPPSIKHTSTPTTSPKKVLELPKWNNSPVLDRNQQEDHPIYPSSVELMGPLYGPIDLTKLNKVPSSTIKLSSSLKLDREIPTIPHSQGRPQSAGSIRPKTKTVDTKPESRPQSASIKQLKKTTNEDWNLYEKIPLKQSKKVSTFNDVVNDIYQSTLSTDNELNVISENNGMDDDDVDEFDKYLLERYMNVLEQNETNLNEMINRDEESKLILENDDINNLDIDQEPSFLESPNARKIILYESAIPAFAVLADCEEIPACRYIVRVLDVGLLHESDDPKLRKNGSLVSSSAGLMIEAFPIMENDSIRDNFFHSHCLPNKSNSPTNNDLIENIQSEVLKQISMEENEVGKSYLSCSVLIRIQSLIRLVLVSRKRNLVRALSGIKEIGDGLYECISDRLDPPLEEALCGLLLSSIGIELHPLQQGFEDEASVDFINSGERIWAARISFSP